MKITKKRRKQTAIEREWNAFFRKNKFPRYNELSSYFKQLNSEIGDSREIKERYFPNHHFDFCIGILFWSYFAKALSLPSIWKGNKYLIVFDKRVDEAKEIVPITKRRESRHALRSAKIGRMNKKAIVYRKVLQKITAKKGHFKSSKFLPFGRLNNKLFNKIVNDMYFSIECHTEMVSGELLLKKKKKEGFDFTRWKVERSDLVAGIDTKEKIKVKLPNIIRSKIERYRWISEVMAWELSLLAESEGASILVKPISSSLIRDLIQKTEATKI